MNAHSVRNASLAWKTARSDAAGWLCASCDFPQTPLELLALAQGLGRPYMFWQSADRRRSMLGVGEILRLRAAGADRLEAVAAASLGLSAPILLGGFGFSGRGPLPAPFGPFAPADFMVPQLLFEERDGDLSLRLLGRSEGDAGQPTAPDTLASLLVAMPGRAASGRLVFADPPGSRAAWRDEVDRARVAIRSGGLQKVVLARTSLALASEPWSVPNIVRELSLHEPDCNIFAFHRKGRTFLGATPERLVRVADGTAEVACLAGSAPRGATTEEDRAIGQELLRSAKNRAEHHFVVTAVEGALRARGLAPEVAAAPSLKRLKSVQHLYTPVRTPLGARETIFTLADALHPTPALGGTPQGLALSWIFEHERAPRGLYGGAIGYAARDGEGEFDVAIRCALVRGRVATLWAGSGIVEDSDPDEELKETDLKFRPLREALQEAIRT